ncbi:hypothetical protein MJT46_000880 [Ovis ammon polii x Ovis aries]|nr:hypothetical protein MJT46_000880 [Ovis ammon polii x Ovis aries]
MLPNKRRRCNEKPVHRKSLCALIQGTEGKELALPVEREVKSYALADQSSKDPSSQNLRKKLPSGALTMGTDFPKVGCGSFLVHWVADHPGCMPSTSGSRKAIRMRAIGVFSIVAKSSGVHIPLQGIRGGFVLIHVIKKQEAEPEEVSWGFGSESNYRVLLRVRRGADTPTWVSLQDKYQHRVHVPSVTSLRIENLIPEDSGQYRARVSFTGGIEFNQVFHLTVYEPVPLPHILLESPSITPGWCNVTLECRAPGNTEGLKVTWESEGLPRELEWSGTPGPAPSSWSLTVNLSLSQPNASLTCVVSNQMDQKTATLDLGEVCSHGTGLQDDDRNHGCEVHCAMPSQPESREDTYELPKGALPDCVNPHRICCVTDVCLSENTSPGTFMGAPDNGTEHRPDGDHWFMVHMEETGFKMKVFERLETLNHTGQWQ